MKKINRFFSIITLLMILINVMYAFGYTTNAATSYDEMMSDAREFIQKGKELTNGGSVNVQDMTSEFVPIGQILTMIGTGVMVAVTTYMGIKYLLAGPEAQAKLKQQLIGVIVSGMVIFGAYGIWSTVLRIAQNFDS